ncbi:hypothetical protein P6P90_10395 [Ectobacillus antri]|jgi:hypothetical protein|uniref:Uncharacterized protein n=1 Tax=Ectobacillus antri TaxID=2486280 RepID=A0ABT6H4U4_9BACI|nr:hypothetical protein [Ectobacillus antri]MDG4657269.1 hypothetical protein [Ectobacillus antri]MDG5754379.1 hypothetical protein [Ectobacillus antri]
MEEIEVELRALKIVSSWIKKLSHSENRDKMLTYEVQNQEAREMLAIISSQLQQVEEQMENMRWLVDHYRILHEFAQTCTKTLNEDELMQKAYTMVSQVMPTDSFYIALYNEGDTFIRFPLLIDNEKLYPEDVTEFGENYTSDVIRARKIVQAVARHIIPCTDIL